MMDISELFEEEKRGKTSTKGSDQIKIETVSIDEIYLLDDDGNRTKRICGRTKSDGTKNPCLNRAGLRTDHKGFGNCYRHEGNTSAQNKRWSRFIKQKIKKGDFLNYIDAASGISDDEIEDLYEQVRIVDAAIKHHIDSNHNRWDTEDTISLIAMIERRAKMTVSAHKLKQGFFMTPKNMELFFGQIRAIMEREIGIEEALRVYTVMTTTILFSSDSVVTDEKMTDGLMRKIQKSEEVFENVPNYHLGDGNNGE